MKPQPANYFVNGLFIGLEIMACLGAIALIVYFTEWGL